MAFFQDLGKKITNVAQDASKKTSELIEISKLNSAINTEKNAIAETQRKIGAAAYSLHMAGEPLPEPLLADIHSIAERLKNISDLENKIAEIKSESDKPDGETAAAAPAAAAPAADAAPAAAAPEQPADAAPAAPRFCTGCGAPLEAGMLFCGKCGQKNG